MAKLPAIQFYPGDWRKDVGVQSLSYHDRGVWFELLMLMHESEKRGLLILNGRPIGEDAIGRILGLDKQILTTTLSELLSTGVASRDESTGALMCRRMVRDEELRKIRAEAGKLGGNPVLLNQKSTTKDKQKPTPSSSSSLSLSITTLKTITPQSDFELPPWIDIDIWEAYLDVRKSKRAAKSSRAWNLVIKQLDGFRAKGYDPNVILETSVRSNWTDVYEPQQNGNGNNRGKQNGKTDRAYAAATDLIQEIEDNNGAHSGELLPWSGAN